MATVLRDRAAASLLPDRAAALLRSLIEPYAPVQLVAHHVEEALLRDEHHERSLRGRHLDDIAGQERMRPLTVDGEDHAACIRRELELDRCTRVDHERTVRQHG